MNNTTPTPLGFDDAIEKMIPDITCTNDIIVEIEETRENEIRIATIANLFGVSPGKVEQAIIEGIEQQLIEGSPDKEQTEHLILKQQEGFQHTGD